MEENRLEKLDEERINRLTKLFRGAGILCAIIHILLCNTFYVLEIKPLFIFNVCSVIIYLFSIGMLKASTIKISMRIAYSEMILHSIVSVAVIGWSTGFALYIIAMIPVSFYIFYISSKKSFEAYGHSILAIIAFFAIRIMAYEKAPISPITDSHIEKLIYIYNGVITCGIILVSTIIFVSEIYRGQRELEEKNELLTKIASSDALTGIMNRRSMGTYLKEAHKLYEEEGDVYFIAIGDIDNFKNVNDTYGHDCGDEVIIMIADIISKGMDEESECSRWGGEEFLILMEDVNEIEAQEKIENIRKQIDEMVHTYKKQDVKITMTFGISMITKRYTLDDVIVAADNNLYEGKELGKNRVIFRNI